MFSKELEALIEASLADGILEDNEKAALVKRAEKEGVDVAELEIYINSIMQKRRQTKTAEEDAREEVRQQNRKKEIGRTCPHCGTVMPPLAEKCPNCGEWVLTPGLNEKLEKEFETIRQELIKLEAMDSGAPLADAARAAKSRVSTLQLRYTSIEKVQTFCNITGKRIEELEQKGYQGKKLAGYILGGCGLGFIGGLCIAMCLESVIPYPNDMAIPLLLTIGGGFLGSFLAKK